MWVLSAYANRRRVLLGLGAALLAQLLKLDVARAQQSVNLPSPDGGPQIREIIIPNLFASSGFFGLATVDGWGPVIFFDGPFTQSVGGVGAREFRFVRAHEYAHHRLNHLPALIMAQANGAFWVNYQAELDADCWATQVLMSNGHTSAVIAGAEIYGGLLPPGPMNGRPGALDRIGRMRGCGAPV